MTELVGILNITPDSFSDGRENLEVGRSIEYAHELIAQGASLIDVGAESTRPGAAALTWKEETDRLYAFLLYAAEAELQISIDTYHPETVAWASKMLPRGFIINDVTSFKDPQMREHAARSGNKLIVSHLPEDSSGIQDAHEVKLISSVNQVAEELSVSVSRLLEAGVDKENIIVDPGIGFGKTKQANFDLLEFARFMPDHDVMIGYSRKRFLGAERLDIGPNLAAGRLATAAGAKYLRVHDVAGHAPLIT